MVPGDVIEHATRCFCQTVRSSHCEGCCGSSLLRIPPPPHARPQLIDRHREDLLPFTGELIANPSLHFPSDERPVRVSQTDRKEEAKPRSAGNRASVRDHLTRKSAM